MRPDQTTGRIHVEVAGVTCVAWSTMNQSKTVGWYHPSAGPCMVEAYWCKHLRPSIIVVECVKGFDAETWLEPLKAFPSNFKQRVQEKQTEQWSYVTQRGLIALKETFFEVKSLSKYCSSMSLRCAFVRETFAPNTHHCKRGRRGGDCLALASRKLSCGCGLIQ